MGPIKPVPSLIKLIPKVNGGPINCILYRAVSVQTNISCLAFTPPIIDEPDDNLSDPAVLVDNGSKSSAFSWSPFTFGINLINEGTGLIGPKAATTTPSGVYWMSYNNFYSYNGSVQTLPCSVHNYVFGDINLGQSFKINAFTIKDKSEVGWFYCSSSATEVDRYVIYNYVEGIWFYGKLSRTAWLDSGIENFPRAVSGGYLYQQELGFNDDGSPMTNVFIESSDLDIGDGEQFSFIKRIIPDYKFIQDDNSGNVNVVLKTRNFPDDPNTPNTCLLYTSPSPRDGLLSRMPSSA